MNPARRRFVTSLAAALVASRASAQSRADDVTMRAIPRSGERIPCVGLGTAWVYDRDADATRKAAGEVLRALLDAGGRLVDTASTYGEAEAVLGAAIAVQRSRDRLFIATKVEEPDDAEFRRSLARLRTPKVDLLQLHNVRDPRQSLAKFREWKAQGLCRYLGITSTYHNDFDAVAAVLSREKPDFVQIDYSIDNRLAERRILPLAADTGAAVLTALPFGRARLFRAVRDRTLPDWAKPFAESWAQFFLKFLLADPRVTAVIPGTTNAAHMTDNAGAMRGRLPDADERQRMVAYVERL
ncbi:MAG TPA: aldo/keto reductase [Casimicrobiaceae bacterium]|nr:aldo/keto reductase [Casimicrobiaceae bacterium]